MEQKTQNLKELYEKDFYLWVQENLKSVKAKVQERENIQSAWEWAVYRLITGSKNLKTTTSLKNTLADFPRKKIFQRNVLIPLSR
jgi:hypothetical protein